MSIMATDEELLGEDDSDGAEFDITDEREKELLQEDDCFKSRDVYDNYNRKSSMSDIDEQDILNLDVEEDFQDVDEKSVCGEEKESKEADASQGQKLSNDPKTTEEANQCASPERKIDNNAPLYKLQKRNFTRKRIFPWNDKNRRGGGGWGRFQTRTNFSKSLPQRRRNGTVLINPRFEGTVHVDENNGRLAWDSAQYTQNSSNSIPLWGGGSYEVNSQVQFVKNILINSAPLLPPVQQPVQNFYEPPAPEPNTYERPLLFEPPPNINENLNLTYNGQRQIPTHQIYPPTQLSSHQSGSSGGTHPLYDSQLPNNAPQGNSYIYNDYANNGSYGSYDRPTEPHYFFDSNKNSYQSEDFSHNRFKGRIPPDNTNRCYTSQKNATYVCGFEYHNRCVTYRSNLKPILNDYVSNYGDAKCATDNRQMNLNSANNRRIYLRNFKQDSTRRTTNLKKYTEIQNKNLVDFSNNNYASQQNRSMIDSNILVSPNNKNKSILSQKFINTDRRSSSSENSQGHLPEKKVKIKDTTSADVKKSEIEQNDRSSMEVASKVEEEEDEEGRIYRQKIEEQKKERERLLRIKEERRKQMMMQRLKRDEDWLLIAGPSRQESSEAEDGKNCQNANNFEHFANISLLAQKSDQNLTSVQSTQDHARTDCSVSLSRQPLNPSKSSFHFASRKPSQKWFSASQDHSSNIPSSNSAGDISNLTFKVSNRGNAQLSENAAKIEASSSSSFMSNRVVVVKSKNCDSEVASNAGVKSDSSDGSSFQNNRKVLKKDNTLLNTRLVVVHNLSTGINRDKLVALTRGIGEIQNLEVDKQERQATILFKSVASAHVFFKKYQRRILDDLSVIEVKLEPMAPTLT